MPTALLFSGQGAQNVGLGKSFYENSALVRDLYKQADAILGWSLTNVSFEGPDEELTLTRVCQPALFVAGYAGYLLLQEAGKLDDLQAALGLSLGELTALTVAGAFDFETGLKVVAERGRLMQDACDQTEGGMASVIGAERDAVGALCEEFDIDMANLNCPGQIVISGEKTKIAAAVEGAKGRPGFRMVKTLNVAGAYHSRLMEPARAAFEAFLQDIPVETPRMTVFTNTTAQIVTDPAEIKAALVKQVVSSVLWEDCMRGAAALGIDSFYECGPGGILAGMAKRIDRGWTVRKIADFSDL